MPTHKLKKLVASNEVPLYIQLAENIRQLIIDGEVSAGDALPSERELKNVTGTSRVTIRKAIRVLVDEGLLSSRHGAGTYINSEIEQHGDALTSFTQDAIGRGEDSSSVWLTRSTSMPTQDEAKHLCLNLDAHVARFGRLRLSNGEPLAIEHAVVPLSILPDPSLVTDSLYSALSAYGKQPTKGNQKICASLATPTEAGLLSISENSEVLRIERNTFLADGTPVEYTRSVYRGDQYVFVTDLHLPEFQ